MTWCILRQSLGSGALGRLNGEGIQHGIQGYKEKISTKKISKEKNSQEETEHSCACYKAGEEEKESGEGRRNSGSPVGIAGQLLRWRKGLGNVARRCRP